LSDYNRIRCSKSSKLLWYINSNYIGITKLEGEKVIQEICNEYHYIILRVPVLYGAGESAVTQLVDVVKSHKQTVMDNYCRRYPTNVLDVAKVLQELTCIFL
jgi:S-adenosylmethionine synthetase